MRLITTVSFLMLIFGMIEADINSDFNELMQNVDLGLENSVLGIRSSCIFGVKSVSTVLFTSDNTEGRPVEIDKFCNLFDPSKLVVFITHGFLANAYNYNFSDLASALVKNDRVVFSTDWSNASCYNDPSVINLLEYPFAVQNTHEVGEYLARYIKSVNKKCEVPLENITVMGHSLGAHISSFAAKNLKKDPAYGKLPLLIGTDPAAPLFILQDINNRFDKSDAKRVVAVHTSLLGLQWSLGHCDLWFNDGISQPACDAFLGIGGTVNVNCSHNVAIEYITTPLLGDCVYLGVPILHRPNLIPRLLPGCSSNTKNCVIVDKTTIFDKDSTLTGDYCVSVSSKYPYCTKNDFNCQT